MKKIMTNRAAILLALCMLQPGAVYSGGIVNKIAFMGIGVLSVVAGVPVSESKQVSTQQDMHGVVDRYAGSSSSSSDLSDSTNLLQAIVKSGDDKVWNNPERYKGEYGIFDLEAQESHNNESQSNDEKSDGSDKTVFLDSSIARKTAAPRAVPTAAPTAPPTFKLITPAPTITAAPTTPAPIITAAPTFIPLSNYGTYMANSQEITLSDLNDANLLGTIQNFKVNGGLSAICENIGKFTMLQTLDVNNVTLTAINPNTKQPAFLNCLKYMPDSLQFLAGVGAGPWTIALRTVYGYPTLYVLQFGGYDVSSNLKLLTHLQTIDFSPSLKFSDSFFVPAPYKSIDICSMLNSAFSDTFVSDVPASRIAYVSGSDFVCKNSVAVNAGNQFNPFPNSPWVLINK